MRPEFADVQYIFFSLLLHIFWWFAIITNDAFVVWVSGQVWRISLWSISFNFVNAFAYVYLFDCHVFPCWSSFSLSDILPFLLIFGIVRHASWYYLFWRCAVLFFYYFGILFFVFPTSALNCFVDFSCILQTFCLKINFLIDLTMWMNISSAVQKYSLYLSTACSKNLKYWHIIYA